MKIKIKFCDFWDGFDSINNDIYNFLSRYFDIELSDNPDFLIYSNYGQEFLKNNCIRIFYNGENQRTNWNACDFSFSFDYLDDPRHYRLPNWVWYADVHKLLNIHNNIDSNLLDKTNFCNMVVSNSHAKKRIDFFHKLSTYKKVDSGGKYLNNIGRPIKNKYEFIKKYKFTLAFENSSYPGYTTEKLIDPMLNGSIPIYWGDPLVHKDFNKKAFINVGDFQNDIELIEYIKELDNNNRMYIEMLAEPKFNENKIPEFALEENILHRFNEIFNSKGVNIPVSQTFRKNIHLAQDKLFKLNFVIKKALGIKGFR